MTEPERTALEHIRRVAESVIQTGNWTSPPSQPPVQPPVPPPTPPPAASGDIALLNVPYVSQFGAGADQYTHDSAAAAGAMLVRAYTPQTPTPDEFFSKSGQSSDQPLSLRQVSAALVRYGISAQQRSRMRLLDLTASLASGRPLLLPLKHAVLQAAGLTSETTAAPHYVVAVGLDMARIYIHDPLRRDGSGQGLAVPILVLYRAWTEIAREMSSYERSALIPRSPLRRFVSANTVINIRSGPGTNHSVVGQTKTGEIFETSKILGDWGQIGDGRWLALRYTRDI